MKKLLKTILASIALTASALSFSACNSNKKTIGIIQFGTHESLNDCYNGMIKGLKDELKETFDEYFIDRQNSNFDAASSAAQANTFVSKKASIIGAIATPSAMAAASAAKGTIPVIYCAVSDPKAAGLTEMNNVTCSSYLLDSDSQLSLIKSFIPTVGKIGVLYTLGEANSISQIETLDSKAKALNIEIVRQSITNASEIPTATDTLLNKGVDCLTNLTDNTVVGALDVILSKTNAKKIPVFGSEIDQVKGRCLASASLDYVSLGEKTGTIMAKVLKGEAKASNDIAIKIDDSFNCYSDKVAKQLDIKVPEIEMRNVD